MGWGGGRGWGPGAVTLREPCISSRREARVLPSPSPQSPLLATRAALRHAAGTHQLEPLLHDQDARHQEISEPSPLRHRHLQLHHHRGCQPADRSEEHTSELQSLMRISYAVFCLKTKKRHTYKK